MRIVQITVNGNTTQGLGDDGKLYRFDNQSRKWVPMEAA